MRHRTRSSAALVAAAMVISALLVPSASAADGGSRIAARGKKLGDPQISTKPVPVGNGYSLTLGTFAKGMSVRIAKGSENDGQFYIWTFGGMSNPVKVNKKMTTLSIDATLATNDEVGASGLISMTGNKEKPKSPAEIAGCQGVKWEMRGGALAGSFTFDTGTDLFGVIELDSLELDYVRRTVGKSRCTDPPVCPKNHSAAFHFAGGMLWTAELEGGQQLLVADVRKSFTNGYFAQILRETNPASSVQAASDLSSASLHGAGNISGSASYVADTPRTSFDGGYGCGTEYRSTGWYSGDMVFHYDLGTVEPFSTGDVSGLLLEGK